MDPATIFMICCIAGGLMVEPGWRWHPQARERLEGQRAAAGSPASEAERRAPHATSPGHDGRAGKEAAEGRGARAAFASAAAWLGTRAGAGVVIPCTLVTLFICWRMLENRAERERASQNSGFLEEAASALSDSDFDWAFPASAALLVGAGAGLVVARALYRQSMESDPAHQQQQQQQQLQQQQQQRGAQRSRRAEPKRPNGGLRPSLEDVFSSDLMGGPGKTSPIREEPPDPEHMPEQFALWTPQVSVSDIPAA